MLLSFLVGVIATYLLTDPALALALAAPVASKAACPPGECCEFKLRLYQRCVPLDSYGKKEMQTWPLFYDFLHKDRSPIEFITGDYNRKACLEPEEGCGRLSVGNITGPDNFYMRWQYSANLTVNEGKGWVTMTYWYGGVDHKDFERGVVGDWTDYPGELTRWVNDCEDKGNHAFANRTRVCLH